MLIYSCRFEEIFHCRFGVTFSKDMEKLWHFASKHIPDFYMLTLMKETLTPLWKTVWGTCPKMLLYALNELFHVFRGVGASDLDGQCVVVYEILSFASLHCTEQWGKPIDPSSTWAAGCVYHGGCAWWERAWVAHLGHLWWGTSAWGSPTAAGLSWLGIDHGRYLLPDVLRGVWFCSLPPCTTASFNPKQAARKAK